MKKNILISISFLSIILFSVVTNGKCKKPKTTKNPTITDSQVLAQNQQNKDVAETPLKIEWQEISKKYKNSVVQIYSYVNVFNLSDPSKTGSDQYLKVGSGFFISEDGFLLTNFHVVSQAPVIEIRIPTLGDQSFEAEIVGCFPQKDFALLKIKDESLQTIKQLLNIGAITPLELGNSDEFNESQKVMCMGYPLGQRSLKTSIGNISGRESIRTIGECAQTTAPINPGNSGGPFLDKSGKAVGIATLKAEDSDGIGYFIPINVIKTALEGLHTQKILKNVMLGVKFQSTTEATLKFLQNPTDGGIYIIEVEKNSLAEKAEIRQGDVFYEIDGFKLDRYGYIKPSWREAKILISDYISQMPIEGTIKLTIFRNGEKLYKEIQLKDENNYSIKEFYPWLQDAPDHARIGGIIVTQLTLNHIVQYLEEDRDLRKIVKYTKNKNRNEPRVILSFIYPGSVVLNYRPQPDDVVISKVNDIQIKTVQDFRDAVLTGCTKNPEYLTIETEGGFFAAIPVKTLVYEDEIISKINYLEKSPLAQQLAEKYNFKTVDE